RRLPVSVGADLPGPGAVRLRRDAGLRGAPGRRVRLRLEGRSAGLVSMEFTAERKARFDEVVKRYPVKRSALLPALYLAQDQVGYLSTEAIEYVASILDLTPAQVHDTATYYTMFRYKPQGKTHIEVCTNLSCALYGADELVASTCAKLGVREGET